MKTRLPGRIPLYALALALLIVAGCGGPSFEPASAVPRNAAMLARIDLDAVIRDSSFGDWANTYLQDLESRQEYVTFWENLGLDPLEDLSEVFLGTGPEAGSSQYVLVFRGDFDAEQMREKLAAREGATTEEIAGSHVHFIPTDEGERAGIVFPADGYAVAMGEDWVKACTDSMAGREESVSSSEEIQSLLDHVNRDDTIWLAFRIPASLLERMQGTPGVGASPVAGILRDAKPRSLLFSADATEAADGGREAHFQLMVRAVDAEAAAKLNSMASGGVEMAKMMVATSAPRTFEVLKSLEFSAEGDIAKVNLRCDPSLLADIAGEIRSLGGGAGVPGGPPPGM